jgi:hypothetical protein
LELSLFLTKYTWLRFSISILFGIDFFSPQNNKKRVSSKINETPKEYPYIPALAYSDQPGGAHSRLDIHKRMPQVSLGSPVHIMLCILSASLARAEFFLIKHILDHKTYNFDMF